MLPTPFRHLLATYLAPHWVRALAVALLLASLIALNLIQPQILRSFIDTARAAGAPGPLVLVAALYLGVALLTQAVGLAEQYAAESLGWRATNALRADLTAHCLELDLSFHHAHTPGELIERLDGDITVLANFFSRFVLQMIGNGVLLLGILLLLWHEDWRIGLVLLLFSGATLLLMTRLRPVGTHYAQVSRQAAADLFGFLEERLGGLADLQTAGAHGYVLRRLGPYLQVTLHAARRSYLLGSLLGDATSVVFSAAAAATLALGAALLRSGTLSLGTVYLIYQYTTMVRAPLDEITRQARDFQGAAASVARVWQLSTIPRTLVDGPGVALPPGALAVEFRDVSFAYPAAAGGPLPAAVLHAVSFRLAPGRVLGVLGRTGSGKTTLARLLCRLYDPSAGTVLLGGADLRALHRADLARRCGLVTQEVQLFGATVRENLTLFDPSIADERLVAALDGLGLSAWYRALPAGLDTVLAPGGAGLSAGEAQLLAFARVFLRDPDVIILDEASARLDPATERLVGAAVDRLLAGRTAIVIAHRVGTLARADEILILEGGRIVERGARTALAGDPSSRFAAVLRASAGEVLA